ALGEQRVEFACQPGDGLEPLLRLGIVTKRLLGAAQCLVFGRLAQHPAEVLGLLVDHGVSSRRARRDRARPNRPPQMRTSLQLCAVAISAVSRARRESTSSAIQPPGLRCCCAPASSLRYGSNPSCPPINAVAGSYSLTRQSSSSYSSAVRYGGLDTSRSSLLVPSGSSRSPGRQLTLSPARRPLRRATVSALGEMSVPITSRKAPSLASDNAMAPVPVPISATTPVETRASARS